MKDDNESDIVKRQTKTLTKMKWLRCTINTFRSNETICSDQHEINDLLTKTMKLDSSNVATYQNNLMKCFDSRS